MFPDTISDHPLAASLRFTCYYFRLIFRDEETKTLSDSQCISILETHEKYLKMFPGLSLDSLGGEGRHRYFLKPDDSNMKSKLRSTELSNFPKVTQ